MSEKSKQLAKNTAIIAFSKIFTSFLSFILLPFYTKFLSTSEYGTLDLVITYGALLAPIVILRTEIAIFRWLIESRNDIEKTKQIISSIVKLVISIQFVFALIFLTLSLFITIPYMHPILLYIFSLSMSSISLQIARGLGKTSDYAISSVISGLFTIMLCVYLVAAMNMGVEGILIGMSIGLMVGSIYLIFKLKIYKYIVFGRKKNKILNEMLKFSIPMIPNSISWWIVNVSDRTIISAVIGLAANGIYAVSNKFSGLLSSVYSIFDLSWSESASLNIDKPDRDKYFSNVLNMVVKVFGSLCFLSVAIIPLFFNIFVNALYNEAYLYIPILMIGIFANIMIRAIGNIYIAKKMSRKIMNTTLLAAIINLSIDLILIWFIGVWAAVISTAVAYGSMFIYRHYDVKKYINITYEKRIFIKIISIFAVISFLYYINNFWLNMLNLMLAVVIAIAINYNLLKTGFNYTYKYLMLLSKN